MFAHVILERYGRVSQREIHCVRLILDHYLVLDTAHLYFTQKKVYQFGITACFTTILPAKGHQRFPGEVVAELDRRIPTNIINALW